VRQEEPFEHLRARDSTLKETDAVRAVMEGYSFKGIGGGDGVVFFCMGTGTRGLTGCRYDTSPFPLSNIESSDKTVIYATSLFLRNKQQEQLRAHIREIHDFFSTDTLLSLYLRNSEAKPSDLS
jgi:hypothetical protein